MPAANRILEQGSQTLLNFSNTPESHFNCCSNESSSRTVPGMPNGLRFVGIIYFPILIIVGSASNIIVVAAMRRTRGMSKSRDVFTALAMADLSVLLVNPGRYFILLATGFDIRLYSDVICALHTFFTYFLKEAATWILVLMTMERFLFARWPHRSNMHYRRRSKILVWSAALVVLFAKNLAILAKLRVDQGKCDSTDSSFRLAFFGATMVLYSLVPFVLMVIFNATLIKIIRRANKQRQLMLSEEGRQEAKQKLIRKAAGSRANRMLVPVCLLHICLTLPQCVFEILEAVFGWKHRPAGMRREVNAAGISLVMVSLLNNAVNGFVYFFSSKNFRRNVCQLLRGEARRLGGQGGPGTPGGGRCDGELNGSHAPYPSRQSRSPSRVSRSLQVGDAGHSELVHLAGDAPAGGSSDRFELTTPERNYLDIGSYQRHPSHAQPDIQPSTAALNYRQPAEYEDPDPEADIRLISPELTPELGGTRVCLLILGNKVSHL